MSKRQHHFRFLYVVYEDEKGLKIKHREFGMFRKESKKEAKEHARTIWDQFPDTKRLIIVVNENKTEIVNYSN